MSVIFEYLKKNFGPDNVTYKDDYVNVEDLDWFKESKMNESLDVNFRFYHTRDNLTQGDLVDKLGTTRQDVSKMERNCRPISKKKTNKLASIFKTSPQVFI